MTTGVPTGETPFKLTFGTEAVIPMEIGLTNIRVKAYDEQRNRQEFNNNFNLINEVRDKALKRMKKYKGVMARYYNKKVKVRRFNVSDLVLRKVSQETKDSSQGKLGPAWEGPYQVILSLQGGIILLEDTGWPRTTSSMEHKTLKEILPIRTVPKYSKIFTAFTFIFLLFVVICFT